MRNSLLLEILVKLGGSGHQRESRNTILNKILVQMGGQPVDGSRNQILEAILNV